MKFKFNIPLCFILFVSLLLLSCDKEKTNLLDTTVSEPFISWIGSTPDIVDTDTILVGGQKLPTDQLNITLTIGAKISDRDGIGDISDVSFHIYKPASTSVIAQGILSHGIPPDSISVPPNEIYYSGTVTFHISRVNVGNYSIEVSAKDNAGVRSNAAIHRLNIRRQSRAPVLFDLDVPDTVMLPSDSLHLAAFTISVAVSDSDGLGDIAEVFFRNLDSPSDPTKKNFLFDDGNTDYDAVAGDGIYSRKFYAVWNQFADTLSEKSYRFKFTAVDQLEYESAPITTTIVLKRP